MDQNNVLSPSDRRAFWIAAVELWRSSGLSMAAFCRREKLCDKTFWAWRKRIESRAAAEVGSVAIAESVAASGRALFQRLHIVREAVAGTSQACGIAGPVERTPVNMEIVLSGQRRIVLHGDALAPARRTGSPRDTVLAEVVRILEGVASAGDVPVASGSEAALHGEGRPC
jgi:hypothetical protein